MVDMGMDRDVTEGLSLVGNDVTAPNGRIAVLYDGFMVGEIDTGGRNGKEYYLFELTGERIRTHRRCNNAEDFEIREGIEHEVYGRCPSEYMTLGSIITFITL